MNIIERNVLVQHWRFEDGKTSPNQGAPKELLMEPPPRGWYCWVYPALKTDFERWMEENCPTAEITWRFNSGNPMFQTYIKDDQEAMTFMLRWDIKQDPWDR